MKNIFRILFIFLVSFLAKNGDVFAQSKLKKGKSFNVVAFYSGNWDVAHISYVHEANKWFAEMAAQYGFKYDSTNNWNNLNEKFLSKYQIVMFLDNSPQTESQQQAFERYMKKGGGFIGYHVSAFNTDPEKWPWYFNDFLGTGKFAGNTWKPTSANLKVEKKDHPSTKGLPELFKSSPNEWYKWENDVSKNPDISVLMSIDPSSFPLGTKQNEIWYSGYYPVVWTNKNYRMLYINMGHNDMIYNPDRTVSYTFANDTQNQFLLNGLFWLGGKNQKRGRG